MNYKTIFYAISLLLNIYVLSGVNFSNIMKKNSYIESRLLVMVLACSLSYLVTNFILSFLGL